MTEATSVPLQEKQKSTFLLKMIDFPDVNDIKK